MSADLISGTLELPQSLNRYTYVMNDPVNLVDPTGGNWLTSLLGAIWNWLNNPPEGSGGGGGGGGLARIIPMPEEAAETGGGGGGGGSGPHCTLTIRVYNQNNLPADQLAAIENQIAKLFGTASVGVNFVNGGDQKEDAVVNFEDPGWFARSGLGSDNADFGHTIKGGGPSFVHSGLLKDAFRSRSLQTQSMIIGTATAHELIHQLLQWADVPTPKGRDKSDIMSAGGHTTNGYSSDQAFYMVNDLFKLTSKEQARLLEDCLRRKKP